MIHTRDMVPYAYSKSREYQVFLKLLDLVINASKSEVDNFLNLINPDKCPDHMLPLLASYVGYEYDYNEKYSSNRVIIKHFNELIRNRGNSIGIGLAIALAITATGAFDDVNLVSLFRINYDRKTNTINIYLYYNKYLSKVRDLIEVVRPAGTRLRIVPAESISTIDEIQISDYITSENLEKYIGSDRYKVGDKSRVGFSEIAGNPESEGFKDKQ